MVAKRNLNHILACATTPASDEVTPMPIAQQVLDHAASIESYTLKLITQLEQSVNALLGAHFPASSQKDHEPTPISPSIFGALFDRQERTLAALHTLHVHIERLSGAL